jgi:hypothetical protein
MKRLLLWYPTYFACSMMGFYVRESQHGFIIFSENSSLPPAVIHLQFNYQSTYFYRKYYGLKLKANAMLVKAS